MTLVCNRQNLAGSCVKPPTIQLRICRTSKFAPAAGTAAPSTLNTRNELE